MVDIFHGAWTHTFALALFPIENILVGLPIFIHLRWDTNLWSYGAMEDELCEGTYDKSRHLPNHTADSFHPAESRPLH